jgi:hypothetical protein
VFTSFDWDSILQAMVDLENAALTDVDAAFSAVKYEPARISGYPRAYRLDWMADTGSRSAGGITGGDYNEDAIVQIGIAVAPATEPRSTAQPKAEAFYDPILNLYRGHLTLNSTVDYIKPNGLRIEMGMFQPPAQVHFGLLVTVPFRKIVTRETAP